MRYCIYKLKEKIELDITEEIFSRYVYVVGFAKNPVVDKELQILYQYIDIDTLDHGSPLSNFHILPPKEFEKCFDLFWNVEQINDKMRQLHASQID